MDYLIHVAKLSLVVSLLVLSVAHACPTESNNNQEGTLRSNVYQNSCPDAEPIVFSVVAKAVADDPRMAASLLRLHFHDCFGCDGSVLLDDTPIFVGEKSAAPNLNSLRGFEVIDAIKSNLESVCPETVSCADILAIAARDSVILSGGPGWDVQTGRRDSLSASKTFANNNIPGPNSNIATLVSKFQNVGLDLNDMVTLSGAHTIGKARCSTFSSRLNGVRNPVLPGQDMGFLESLQHLFAGAVGELTELREENIATPDTRNNATSVNLQLGECLLATDRVLQNILTKRVLEKLRYSKLALMKTAAMGQFSFKADCAHQVVRIKSMSSHCLGVSAQIRYSLNVVVIRE
ncbi:hypothetical protein Sjap_006990 [Stephania japonica]|uniref:Peroxidase n=1 Tax=Stephania japonica TaxID=461633 RepID=A0AAP0K6Y0_9MAGN